MKFTIERNAAADAVKMCLAGIGGKTTLPILSCLRLEARDGELSILATDLDRWIECRVPAQVTKPGSVALSGRLFSGILAKGSDDVSIEVDGKNKATVKFGDSSFRISGLPASEFPPPETNGKGRTFPISASSWLDGSRCTSWALGDDVNRLAITGLFLTTHESSIRMVATNGRCMSVATLENSETPERDAIIPGSTVGLIDAIADTGAEMNLTVTDSVIVATCGGNTVTSKLVDTHYPNYRQVLPDPEAARTHVKVSCKALLEAIERVALVVDSGNPGIVLEISADSIALTGGKEDAADAKTRIEASSEGPPLKVKVNERLLIQPLRRWPFETICFDLIDEMSPIAIRSEHLETVIMPMRILN